LARAAQPETMLVLLVAIRVLVLFALQKAAAVAADRYQVALLTVAVLAAR